MMKTTFQLSTLAALVALLVLTGCEDDAQNNNGEEERQALPVETLTLSPTAFEERVELTGSVEARDDATLSAQGNGTLVMLQELGTELASGAVVAQLDSLSEASAVRQARAQLRTAEVQLESAEDAYRRQEPLYRDSVISAIEFEQVRSQRDQARAAVEQAEAALEQARDQLDNTTLRMPFAGTVEEHLVRRGEQISPGMPVARVVNTEQVRVEVGVPERYSDDISVGQEVDLRFGNRDGNGHTGQIVFVSRAINPGSRTFSVEVEVDNPEGRLKPEMTARVSLPLRQREDVLVIPRRAAERDEEGYNVYVVREENGQPQVEARLVELGPSYEGRVVVESGLEPGDELVVGGQEALSAGTPVNITERHDEIDQTLLQPRSTAQR